MDSTNMDEHLGESRPTDVGRSGSKGRSAGPPARARSRHKVVVVANRTGGQGKTLLTQLLYHRLGIAELFCADSMESVGNGRKLSKLGHLFGTSTTVHDLGSGPSDEDIRSNPDALRSFWDLAGQMYLKDGVGDPPSLSILDLGANVVDSLISWAVASKAKDAFSAGDVSFDFVVPMMASPQAIIDALGLAKRLDEDALPVERVVFVCNEAQGCFDGVAAVQMREIASFAKSHDGRIIHLARCDSSIMRLFESQNKPVGDVFAVSSERELAVKHGLNFFQVNRHLKVFSDWVERSSLALVEALDLRESDFAAPGTERRPFGEPI